MELREVRMKARVRDDCFRASPRGRLDPGGRGAGAIAHGPGLCHRHRGRRVAGSSGARSGRGCRCPPVKSRRQRMLRSMAMPLRGRRWAKKRTPSNCRWEAGRAAAGHPFKGTLAPGYAVRILTGAELPRGADTVVLQEDATVRAGRVRFAPPRKKAANSRGLGEDAADGEVVLPAGRRVGPPELARLISVGIDRVIVRERLRVGVNLYRRRTAATGCRSGGPWHIRCQSADADGADCGLRPSPRRSGRAPGSGGNDPCGFGQRCCRDGRDRDDRRCVRRGRGSYLAASAHRWAGHDLAHRGKAGPSACAGPLAGCAGLWCCLGIRLRPSSAH